MVNMSSSLFFLLIGGLALAILALGLNLFVSSDMMTNLLINSAIKKYKKEEKNKPWYEDIPR